MGDNRGSGEHKILHVRLPNGKIILLAVFMRVRQFPDSNCFSWQCRGRHAASSSNAHTHTRTHRPHGGMMRPHNWLLLLLLLQATVFVHLAPPGSTRQVGYLAGHTDDNQSVGSAAVMITRLSLWPAAVIEVPFYRIVPPSRGLYIHMFLSIWVPLRKIRSLFV